MSISLSFHNKLLAAASGGAMLVASILISDKTGLEGCSYRPYKDITGRWTVCYGHTGNDIIKNKIYNVRECNCLLQHDMLLVKKGVDVLVKKHLTVFQKAAIYSFTYNVGLNSFSKSTLLKKINAGNMSAACNEILRWKYANGTQWKGLMNRREAELSLCLEGKGHDF
ncbi:lysozyme [Salmonella enterica]|nr:lysozyme [Salmonella enterica]